MMTITVSNTAVKILSAGIILLGLVSYNFIRAWTSAPPNPPSGNAAAPINVGVSNLSVQVGQGSVAFDRLVAFGDTQTYGIAKIIGTSPLLELDDTDTDNNKWWLNSNAYGGSNGRVHFLYDRDNDGAWTAADIMPTMYLESGPTTANDYAYFSNQVRASQYCNSDGSRCATIDEMLANLPPATANEIVYLQTPFKIPFVGGKGGNYAYILDMPALGYPANVIKVYMAGSGDGYKTQTGTTYTSSVTYNVPGVPNSSGTIVVGAYGNSITNQMSWVLLGPPKTVSLYMSLGTNTWASASLSGYECQGACQ